MDPLAEKYYGMSPYNYVGNNPVMRIDPDGRSFIGAYGMLDHTGAADVYVYDEAGYADKAYDITGNPPEFLYGGSSSGKVNDELQPPLVEEKKEEEAAENQTAKNDQANEIMEDVAFGTGLFTTMVSEAARGIISPIVTTIGRTAGALGGVMGTIDNTVQASTAFSEGNYGEGIFQTIQAIGYAGGTGMLFTPLAPVGAVILGANTAIDVGEYFYKNW